LAIVHLQVILFIYVFFSNTRSVSHQWKEHKDTEILIHNQGRRNGGALRRHYPQDLWKLGQRGHKCPYITVS